MKYVVPFLQYSQENDIVPDVIKETFETNDIAKASSMIAKRLAYHQARNPRTILMDIHIHLPDAIQKRLRSAVASKVSLYEPEAKKQYYEEREQNRLRFIEFQKEKQTKMRKQLYKELKEEFENK